MASDATCVSRSLLRRPSICVIPLLVAFNRRSFGSNVSLGASRLCDQVQARGRIPGASRPSTKEFTRLFRALGVRCSTTITMRISDGLDNAVGDYLTKSRLTKFPISTISSGYVSCTVASLVCGKLGLTRGRVPMRGVTRVLRDRTSGSRGCVLLNDLRRFCGNNEVSKARCLLKDVLGVGPVVHVGQSNTFRLFSGIHSSGGTVGEVVRLLKSTCRDRAVPRIRVVRKGIQNGTRRLTRRVGSRFPHLSVVVNRVDSAVTTRTNRNAVTVV